MHTDLKVGMYWGDMGIDFWDAATWKVEMQKHEVLVMTPAILLSGLSCGFFKLNMIKVLIMDECHHARGRYPYACIMTEFYHHQLKSNSSDLPRIFGMITSLIKSKGGNSELTVWKTIAELESLMHSKEPLHNQCVDHNSTRPQFYFDSISIFFHNVLQPPEDEVGGSFFDTVTDYFGKDVWRSVHDLSYNDESPSELKEPSTSSTVDAIKQVRSKRPMSRMEVPSDISSKDEHP
ncbi:hypothetical protein QN277_003661 [Acacia crassicarpa]|uniref:Helicase ATP-binding domain-containing protein n=1 Tax=Acacia crassicarpa TaxID=499986 RepID=A0AAE1IYZ9_9FABA|nr:hypothetical protein QN277_003661 [Acacia crassicarpa]